MSTATQTYRDVLREFIDDHPFGKYLDGRLLFALIGPHGNHQGEMHPDEDRDEFPNLSALGVRPFNGSNVLGVLIDIDLKSARHKNGITPDEMEFVIALLLTLPFKVIIARSKSGDGIHVFVPCEPIPHNGVADAKRIVKEVAKEVMSFLPPKAAKMVDVVTNHLVLWVAEPKPESFQLVGANDKPLMQHTPPAAKATNADGGKPNDIFSRLAGPQSPTFTQSHREIIEGLQQYGPVTEAENKNCFFVSPRTIKDYKDAEGLVCDYDTVSDGSSGWRYCLLIPQPGGTFKVISQKENEETNNWNKENGKNVCHFPSSKIKSPDTYLAKVDAVVRYIGDDAYIIQLVDVGGRMVSYWARTTKDKAVTRCKNEGLEPREALDVAFKNSWAESVVPFVVEPFEGRRIMNPTATTDLIVVPVEGPHPTWDAMLTHTGQGLGDAVAANDWCQTNGIETGRDFLFCWFALAFQLPTARVPGLAFYGDVLSGKTKPAEAMQFIIALNLCFNVGRTLRTTFNSSMMKALFLRCEETNLSNADNIEYAKDLLTSRSVNLHQKGKPARTSTNISRLWQTTNSMSHIPLGAGDERFVVVECQSLGDKVDPDFDDKLEREAAHFLHSLLAYKLPPKHGRLFMPPLMTDLKQQLLDSLVQDSPHIQRLVTLLKDNNFRSKNLTGLLTSNDIARLLEIKNSGQLCKELKDDDVQTYIEACGFKVAESEVADSKSRKKPAFEFTPIAKVVK